MLEDFIDTWDEMMRANPKYYFNAHKMHTPMLNTIVTD
jgi:hypothetical protein